MMIPLLAATTHLLFTTPERGVYSCQQGNSDSICDQSLRPLFNSRGEWNGLQVEYVGQCGSMGPYRYSCSPRDSEVRCGDGLPGGIRFAFKKANTYRWENTQHKFICYKMVKVQKTER